MPRRIRFNVSGIYHVVNRGVGRMTIFADEKDHHKFMQIVHDSREIHQFSIHAHVLMPNHYHLLLQTGYDNLSEAIKQINARYTIFFNKKYHRVGPLWQGRFKSWFVQDDAYLRTLIKYIEFNPVKARICEKMGQFPWSSRHCLAFTDPTDLERGLTKEEQKQVDAHFSPNAPHFGDSPWPISRNIQRVAPVPQKAVADYFVPSGFGKSDAVSDRNWQIVQAIEDGHKQKDIAVHLAITDAQVSRILKMYRLKNRLFEDVKKRGILKEVSGSRSFTRSVEKQFCMQVLMHGTPGDRAQLTALYGKKIKKS